MRRERSFLADIVEAADAAAGVLIAVDRETFVGSDLVRSAVLQKLIIVGEAATHVDATLPPED